MSGCMMFMLACGLCLWILPRLGRLLLLAGGLVGFAIVALVVALIVYSLKGSGSSGTVGRHGYGEKTGSLCVPDLP